MLRTLMLVGTLVALALALTTAPARADHDRELRYMLSGALIGAAIGGLAYSAQHHPPRRHLYAGARHRYYRRHGGYSYLRPSRSHGFAYYGHRYPHYGSHYYR